MFVASQYQPIFRELGIDAEAIFHHPEIRPWRTLGDRQNCTLDAKLVSGRKIRFHVKRYSPVGRKVTPGEEEMRAFELLKAAEIPTPTLISWGRLVHGFSFTITEDLAGYQPADALLAGGFPFDCLRDPLADLTARMHNAQLHHRDLYLCHFFVKAIDDAIDIKLIDVARVKKLPAILPQRWIVKDLAQFWYSTLSLPVTNAQREAWLERYLLTRGESGLASLKSAIERKVARIAKHDVRLRIDQPGRNISIPKKSGTS